jgi:hypothetical protein
MVKKKIDRNVAAGSTFERERDWYGGPQRQPELCAASGEECRHANGVHDLRYGNQAEVLPLRELLGTGK